MTYQLSNRLFLENGPATASAEARARRASTRSFEAVEQAKLDAARIATGAPLRLAA